MAATIGGRPGASAYAASKAAVDVFTAGFAKEVAVEGVRVNVVRPGVILTDMTAGLRDDAEAWGKVAASIPMQRVGAPEEVARAIVWLLSPEASFVTGAHLNVGGGGFVIGTPMR
jgi:NAD(P)-dependent dehydrogenase (short-subunit alcohol dehydrogenase family)